MIDEKILIAQLNTWKGKTAFTGLKEDALIDKVIALVKEQKRVPVTYALYRMAKGMCNLCKHADLTDGCEVCERGDCPLDIL